MEIRQVLLAKNFGPTPEDSPLVQTLAANWKEVMKKDEVEIDGILSIQTADCSPKPASPLFCSVPDHGRCWKPTVTVPMST